MQARCLRGLLIPGSIKGLMSSILISSALNDITHLFVVLSTSTLYGETKKLNFLYMESTAEVAN